MSKNKSDTGVNSVNCFYMQVEVKRPRIWHADELTLFKRVNVNGHNLAVCGIRDKEQRSPEWFPSYSEWVLCYEAGNVGDATGAFVEVICMNGIGFTTEEVQTFHRLTNPFHPIPLFR